MVKITSYENELAFNDMGKFIPNITIDNEVVNDGSITHIEISINGVITNLFIDEITKHYAWKTVNDEECDYSVVEDIGDTLQKFLYRYKHPICEYIISEINDSYKNGY